MTTYVQIIEPVAMIAVGGLDLYFALQLQRQRYS